MKRTRQIGAALVAAISIHTAAQSASATLIDFTGVTDGLNMTAQSHGTTPEVAVSYTGNWLGYVSPWYPEGDGATGGAIYNTTAAGVGTVIFTAEPGYTVQVDSLVLRMGPGSQPSTQGLLEYSLDSGANWTEVATNVAAASTGLVNFSGVEGAVVQIRWSDQRPGGNDLESDAAFDNINYTAVAIPEPASMVLMGLGGMLVLRRRRA